MSDDVKPQRRYDSSRRRARARDNRQRILEAARRLFAERAYDATTVEAIAVEAGVSVPTVYAAFGNKRRLLERLIGSLVTGAENVPILETPGAKAVLAEPDPRRMLRLFARDMRRIMAHVSPIHEVVRSAAKSDPEIAGMHGRLQEYRVSVMRRVAQSLASKGPLRRGLTVDDAGETIWTLTNADVYRLLTVERDWDEERYEQWLAETLIAALLPAEDPSSADPFRV
jgi:AcrR family transcriptional regulator